MVKFRVITDSSSGITQEEAKKLGVTVLPLTLNFQGKDYKDGVDISTDEFYSLVFEEEKKKESLLQVIEKHYKPEAPKTSMVPPQAFVEAMQDAIKDGFIPVVLPISSVLSGTFNSANIAKDMLEDEEIYVLDSHTALGSVKVMVQYLATHEFETMEDVVKEVEYMVKHINFYSVPDTLEYLFRGGRLNRFSATMGTLLRIKPVIQLDRTGKLISISKERGLKHAFMKISEYLKTLPIDFKYPVGLGYSTNKENVLALEEYLKDDLKGPYEIHQISPVVGAHVGPGASALFYISTEEVPDCK